MAFIQKIYGILNFWDTYEGIATLAVIIVLLFKLFINRAATALDFKKLCISIPGEITFLVFGFHLSHLVALDNNVRNVTGIFTCLIALIIQIAIEKYSDDKLGGKLTWSTKGLIFMMYCISFYLYFNVLVGGKANG